MERTKTKDIIRSFDYNGITLLDSHWKRQRDYTVELYLSLDNADLLQRLRTRAGVPDPDHDGLPGWGCNVGQCLGAFAKLYCVTGDYRLKAKAISLFEDWAACADKEKALLHGGTYGFDKLIGGMLDMYEYLGFERAEKYISMLTDQSIIDLDRTIDRDGLQDSRMHGQIEWYTLPEQLFRAYQFFGDEKYLEHANAWLYDYMWDKVLNHDFKIGPRHAYSHVNCLSSAARAYEVTGDKKYLDIMTIAYEELTTHHTYATGGYGPGENLFMDKEGYLGFMIESPWELKGEDPGFINFAGQLVGRSDAWGSCEVSCCAWAVFKYCNYLMRHTGDAKYAAWAEQFIYNCCGGQPDIKPNGELLYYAQYFADGGMKSTYDRRLNPGGINFLWQCCSGTWPQDVAEYSRQLYYFDDESLYVSQYLPSKVDWEKDGVKIEVENFSDFPRKNMAQFHVKAEKGVKFALKLRVPHWATGKNTLYIDGQVVEAEFVPDTWLVIDREWKDEMVSVEFEYKLYLKPVDEKRANLCALCYGPIVLVSTEMTILAGDLDDLDSWIKPVKGEEMTFRTLPGHASTQKFLTRTFVPYYTYPEDKWYFMYFRTFASVEESRPRTF